MTWVENDSDLLVRLTGFEERDGYSHGERFPRVLRPSTGETGDTVARREPPPVTQNEVRVLVYEVMEDLRKWLRGVSAEPAARDVPPAAGALLAAPHVDRAFAKVTRVMSAPDPGINEPLDRFAVLRSAVIALVTEAWIEKLREGFERELAHALDAFRTRLARDRQEQEDWHDELDGLVCLYEVFRPALWKIYQRVWHAWNADRKRTISLTESLRRLDLLMERHEEDS